MTDKLKPGLLDVPETLLWTLHNRANEAKRKDGIIADPKAIEIYDRIDYDYVKNFGKAEPSHAVRSNLFDHELNRFVREHPNGIIINLGEGLETQRFRVKSDTVTWYSVDLPESIAVREQFIEPDERHHHLALSAFAPEWFDKIPQGRPVFITAQGLLMYFEEEQVKWLIQQIARHFENAVFMFDTIPEWFSSKTMKGMKKTSTYTTPQMPWGINRDKIPGTLKRWEPRIQDIQLISFRFPRGASRLLFMAAEKIPFLRNRMPVVVKLRF